MAYPDPQGSCTDRRHSDISYHRRCGDSVCHAADLPTPPQGAESEERAAVVEAYSNGVPSRVLAERYECNSATIRTIAHRAKNAPNQADS